MAISARRKTNVLSVLKGHRSGFEDRIAAELKNEGVRASYEPGRISYVDKPHTYTPDFVLPNGIVIETKGYFLSEDRTKHLRLKEQYPELDLRFVFMNPMHKISKSSKTTYAHWAELKGFKWSKHSIPNEWIKEGPNEASLKTLKEVLKLSKHA